MTILLNQSRLNQSRLLRTQAPQHGFTLMEVLVAIIILALAASGVAAMQLHALRTAQQSGFQTSATQLAVELADIMRANAQLARSSNSHFFSQASTDTEMRDWQQRLQQTLPHARFLVCRDSSPFAADTLRWDCDNISNAPIVIKIGWSQSNASLSRPPPDIALVVDI